MMNDAARHAALPRLWVQVGSAIAFALALLPQPCEARDGRHVRVGLYQNSPKVAVSESGQPAGIFVDVIESIAAEEGWTIDYVPGTWAQGLDRLAAGKIDLMPDVALTHERDQVYAFHREPVLSDWFQVYARRGSGIRSILDLDGQRLSVLERSIQQEAFGNAFVGFDLKVTLVPFPDYKAAFAAVERGEVNAVIANRFYGATHLHASQLEDTAIIFNPTRLYFATTRPANTTLLAAIDRHLLRMKENPTSAYYRSLRRWTSEDVSVRLPPWLKGAGFAAATLLLFSLIGSVALKHQVAIRTRELRNRNEENARLYQEVRQRAAELERRVLERTADLAAAKDRAESADRVKSAFLATMSHELRTPLNSIIGFTGLLLQGLAGQLNDEQTKQLNMVKASGQHLLALINDVLDISKIEAGQIEIVYAPFDLREAIHKVMQTVSPLAEKKLLPLSARLAPDVGPLIGDRRRVEQVLLNLLSNAIKFTERGSVTVAADVVPGTGARPRPSVRVAVTDTGLGIKAEDRDKLFTPFRQLDAGLTRQHEGTGLGLAICKRLIDRMGGTIEIESAWGKGSSFLFTLPLHPELES